MRKHKKALFWGIGAAVVALLVIGAIVLASVLTPKPTTPLTDAQRSALLAGLNASPAGSAAVKKPLKRVIDASHPLNLVTYYPTSEGERKDGVLELWNSIPADIRTYSVLILIPGNVLAPGGEDESLIKLAQTCEQNKIPFSIQNINGETHKEWLMPISYIEKTFGSMEYFYGLSAAELYNGPVWRGEVDGDQSQYVVDCINYVAGRGMFWFWTDTNKFGVNGTMIDWIESNECLYTALKQNSANVFMLNKESYGDPSTYALMSGLYLSGLIGGWGVASDWWHWQVSNFHSLFGKNDEFINGEWERILYYPENMHVQSMMMVSSMGGFCFKNEAQFFTTSVFGKRIAGFEYATVPFLRQLLSGKFQIPTREEVLQETPVMVLGGKNQESFQYDLKESTLYPDMPNVGIVPLLPGNLRRSERELLINAGVTLLNTPATKDSILPFIEQPAQGNTYTASTGDQWYWMNNVENIDLTKSTLIQKLRKNGSESVRFTAGPHTYAMMKEDTASLRFHLNNYRVDKDAMVKHYETLDGETVRTAVDEWLGVQADGSVKAGDSTRRTTTIVIRGKQIRPQILSISNPSGGANARPFSYFESYNEKTKELTIAITHNGPVELEVKTDAGKAAVPSTKRISKSILPPRMQEDANLRNALTEYRLENTSAYSSVSLQTYARAYETCRVMLEEYSGSSQIRKDAILSLKEARGALVDVSRLRTQLERLSTLTPEQKQGRSYEKFNAIYDAALREVLSPAVLFSEKDGLLEFHAKYKVDRWTVAQAQEKQKKIDEQTIALEKAYAELNI